MYVETLKKALNLLQLPVTNLPWKPRIPSIHLSILLPHLSHWVTPKSPISGTLSHYLSNQNVTFLPLANRKSFLPLKATHPLLIFFQTPTMYSFVTPLKHHPPFSSLYFLEITHFQRDSLLIATSKIFQKNLIKSGNIST